MINQLKIQLNLYAHRENDNTIINNLGLNNAENPNKKVRELLYSLATGNNTVIQNDNQNNQQYIDKIAELEKMIETIKNENIILKAENNILNSKFNSAAFKNENFIPSDISTNKETLVNEKPKKTNTKLLGSIKKMEI